MKFELASLEELKSLFLFPFVTQFQNTVFQAVTFSFSDLSTNQPFAQTVDISKIPQQQIHTTFSYIKPYLSQQDSQALDSLLENVYSASDLYVHSVHKLDITFHAPSADDMVLSKYFILQNVSQTTSYLLSIPLQIVGNSLKYAFVVPKQDTSATNILGTRTIILVSTKWSDITLYDNGDNENKTFSASINVAGYDMTRVGVIVLGNNINQQQYSLYGYNLIDQSMILVPTVSTKKAKAFIDQEKIKHLPMTVKISSKAFDGLQYKDYGSLFWSRGVAFQIQGNAQIGVNNQIGSECLK